LGQHYVRPRPALRQAAGSWPKYFRDLHAYPVSHPYATASIASIKPIRHESLGRSPECTCLGAYGHRRFRSPLTFPYPAVVCLALQSTRLARMRSPPAHLVRAITHRTQSGANPGTSACPATTFSGPNTHKTPGPRLDLLRSVGFDSKARNRARGPLLPWAAPGLLQRFRLTARPPPHRQLWAELPPPRAFPHPLNYPRAHHVHGQ